MDKKLHVGIIGRDQLTLNYSLEDGKISAFEVKALGCYEFLKKVETLKTLLNQPLDSLELPPGDKHEDMLVRELILKLKGQWVFPYTDEELCHCRVVPTSIVDQAVLSGAHGVESVSRKTSAGTGCGTCKKDIESVIRYRRFSKE